MNGKIKYILLWAIGIACDLISVVFGILYRTLNPSIEILCLLTVLFCGFGLGLNICTLVLCKHISGRKVKDEEWEEL